MMPLESVSDATIWITITLLESIYSTGIAHDNCQMTVVVCLQYRLMATYWDLLMLLYLSKNYLKQFVKYFVNTITNF